jgi:5'-3' exonuclease
MGIPSYFSYIVKNYTLLLKKINHLSATHKIHNFYLDSNSIIYDSIANIDFTELKDSDVNTIISSVIHKIEEYITLVNPSENIFIAFDGVAPVAKLNQQRSRRYKSHYQNQMKKSILEKNNKEKHTFVDSWNTASITPGTVFMNKLNEKIKNHFTNRIPNNYSVKNIHLSLTDTCGEGEHKIFDFIRQNREYHLKTNTVIYGLDADLIMLCLNHLPLCKNIFLYRETPHFIQNISNELEPNQHYFIDIPELANLIVDDMNNNNNNKDSEMKEGKEYKEGNEENERIHDYIFLCFFLGNDFLPHFPSLNIRTGGIFKMMNAYKATIGGTKEYLFDPIEKKIVWKNVRKLVSFLADLEEEHFKQEMKQRDRRDKKDSNPIGKPGNPEDLLKYYDSLPTHERTIEKFINPFKDNWENRYYKSLFFTDITNDTKKEICTNYLEGLEWSMKYYISGCPDWRWTYKYHYPPLLKDLIHYIPYLDKNFISNKLNLNPVTEMVQLCYVLPKHSLYLLPEKLHNYLIRQKSYWYEDDCEFLWAYCKYFWESHVLLPDIDINELELFIQENSK